MLGAEIHEFPISGTDGLGDLRSSDRTQDIVTALMQEAVDHYVENLEPIQVKATDYYYGREFGNEQEGRSRTVSTDVKDATSAQMPDIMEVFMGSDHVVEFKPQNAQEVPLAQQQTDYINMVVREDNPGYLIFQNAFKDALVRKIGYFKWWWEDYDRVRAYEYSGLSEQAVMVLLQDNDIDPEDVEIVGQSTEMVQVVGPDGEPAQEEVPIYDIRITRFESDGRARFAAVPPEEVVWSPNARDFDTAGIVAHTREVTVDEASRVTGLTYEDIEPFVGEGEHTGSENLRWARQFHGGGSDSTFDDESAKPLSQRSVILTEAYVAIDIDGDDIAELRMFHCLGKDFEIVNGDGDGEIANDIQMSYITPDPEPHTIVGLGNYDQMKDIQDVKSQVRRGMLDSLAQSIDPQLEVVSSEVNMKDVLNPEVGNIIRVRRPGMIREVKHQFIGAETIAVEEHFNEVRADRGGMTRASEGLDPEALQSSTPGAVAATLDKAQKRIQSISRTFAETGVKRLYQGLLQLVIENQDRSRMVELRGEFVDVDPRSWDVNTDVKVNSGLGAGSVNEKIAILASIAADQQALMQAGAPFVSNVEVRALRKRITELSGFAGVAEFYRPWTQEQEEALQEQIANTPPPPDPAVMLVELEKMKTQLKAISDNNKLALEQTKEAWKDDRERDKLARESALKEREIEAELAVEIEDLKRKRAIAADRTAQTPNETTEE